jgi:hypothetical protein
MQVDRLERVLLLHGPQQLHDDRAFVHLGTERVVRAEERARA